MLNSDLATVLLSIAAILVGVLLVLRLKLHPFLGLLIVAVGFGMAKGLGAAATFAAVQKGFGDIMGSTGMLVALGMALGAVLNISGGAAVIAAAALRLTGRRFAAWGALLAALVVGLPLFFETGVVLLAPIVAAAALRLRASATTGKPASEITLLLSAFAGLSVLHALTPPHPGPLIAVAELHADVGRTLIYGLIVGLPTAIIAGPLFGGWIGRRVTPTEAVLTTAEPDAPAPPLGLALAVVLFPVLAIAARQAADVGGWLKTPAGGVLDLVGTPVVALILAIALGLALLFRTGAGYRAQSTHIWNAAVLPAGGILLAIGAGGAFKQVLVAGGLADIMARFAQSSGVSPLLLAWLCAVAIRLAAGSATVATITAAGVVSGIAAHTGVNTAWMALAVGAGSVFFSHVNDPGFWLVKGYLGTSTADTFKTWSAMETIISTLAIVLILILSRFI